MFIILKAAVLFFGIVFVLPIVFFLLVGGFGNYFSLTIDRNSWLANSNIKWLKNLLRRFIV